LLLLHLRELCFHHGELGRELVELAGQLGFARGLREGAAGGERDAGGDEGLEGQCALRCRCHAYRFPGRGDVAMNAL
jgi:hypothetical protein